MQPRKVRLTPATRPMAVQAIYSAPDGYYFEPPKEPTRSLDQNAKLHAMCGDIAKQMPWMGRKLSTDDWKRLLVDAWMRETGRHGAQVVPSLDGKGIVALGVQTRGLGIKAMAELIEYIQSWGDISGIEWSESFHIPGWVK